MSYIDVTGKTEEEAIRKALQQLQMDRDDVSVEILERAKSGFLGIGSSPARVRVTYGQEEPEAPAAPVQPEKKPEKKPEPKPQPKPQQPKPQKPETPKAAHKAPEVPKAAETPAAPAQGCVLRDGYHRAVSPPGEQRGGGPHRDVFGWRLRAPGGGHHRGVVGQQSLARHH